MLRKIIITLLLTLSILFTFTACNGGSEPPVAEPSADNNAGEDIDTAQNNGDDETPSTPAMSFDGLDFPEPVRELVFNAGFTDGNAGFRSRGGESLTVVDGVLVSSGRTGAWNGPMVNVYGALEESSHYEFSAMIMFDFDAPEGEGNERQDFHASLQVNTGGASNEFMNIFGTRLTRGEWTEVNGSFTSPDFFLEISFYFEGGSAYDGLFPDIYLEYLTITHVVAELLPYDFLPPIHEVYTDYFPVGIGVTIDDLRNPYNAALISHHFNSLTMGNEMKPSALLNQVRSASADDGMPVINTAILDECLSFARDNNMGMRGHTLVWHSQTPLWFFKVDYSTLPDAEYASREVMIERMEHYIRVVLEYCQENFPGVIYAWDVVNEAIDPSSNDPNKIRDTHAGDVNPWYHTVGPDYVELSFVFARQYADPGVKLFYNDYNEWFTNKMFPIIELLEGLIEKDLVDGMGMQSHIGIDSPSAIDFQLAVHRYARLDIEVQITELDIKLESNTEDDQWRLATRYKRLMSMFRNDLLLGNANITNVTVWGLTDRDTWLSYRDGAGRMYPLLFDDYMYPKLAFWGFILDDAIPNF